jgi:hypothetical protein
MRARRSIALVLVTAFLGTSGLPWLADRHEFNDDPHWAVQVGDDAGHHATVGVAGEVDDDHCLVCHLQRTLRTASKPSQGFHHSLLPFVTPCSSTPRRTFTSIAGPAGVRGPPYFSI